MPDGFRGGLEGRPSGRSCRCRHTGRRASLLQITRNHPGITRGSIPADTGMGFIGRVLESMPFRDGVQAESLPFRL
jgi:hypothetical protein